MVIQKYKVVLALFLFGSMGLYAQVEKAKAGVFALTNASIQTVTNGMIENGTIVIADGKITGLGTTVAVPAGAEKIDCRGLIVYPGMIDGGNTLGLVEVSSISLTSDVNEIGDINPHMQALTAVNPNAVAIPVTRVSGVTTSLAVPQGGTFPGTAALINLVGYTPDQMFANFKAVVLNFPTLGRQGWRNRKTDEEREKEREKKLKNLNAFWEKAAFYAKLDSASLAGANLSDREYNPAVAAVAEVIKGNSPMMIEVNREKDIRGAIEWTKEQGLNNVIFSGVAEGWRVAEALAESGIPVVTGPVIALPTRPSDRYDQAYRNAAVMHEAGVKVAIRSNDSENVRNLPFHAGYAAAYGMGKEAALKAVTIVPAEIFGVADQLGSIEVGKRATLFVADGDPFETKTQVKHLFINGYKVPIDSRHIQLYEEFLDRTPGLKK